MKPPGATEMARPCRSPEDEGRLSGPLRRAIAESGRSHCALARASGVAVTTIGQFARGEASISLATADKLGGPLAPKAAQASGTGPGDDAAGPLSGPLRRAIAESGRGYEALARAAGLAASDVGAFARCQRGLLISSADRIAGVLGVALVRDAEAPAAGPAPPQDDGPRPIAELLRDSLRAAIAASGVTTIAGAAGVHSQSLIRFDRGESDPCLASVDGLLGVLGLEVVRVPGGSPPEGLAESPRSAIVASPLSYDAIGREAGVWRTSVGGFARGADMKLATAERLCRVLALRVVRGSGGRPTGSKSPPENLPDPIAGPLRAAIAASGLSFYSLGKRSGISGTTISRFIAGRRLGYGSALKLAGALGIELGPASLRARADAPAEHPAAPGPEGPATWSGSRRELASEVRQAEGEKVRQVVGALAGIAPRRCTGAELVKLSGLTDAVNIFKRFASGPSRLARASIIPGRGGRGYGLDVRFSEDRQNMISQT